LKLSVIIVNYNVRHFLEQCLHAAFNATRKIRTEIFVVDNHSVDGSSAMVKEKFPEVILIENYENLGFAKANNQAIKKSKGEYVLLLNPDTVVEEDTFQKVVEFMDSHPEAGGLGVKMIDGKGNFLPESKRGLPTPSVAFYKIFGLSKIFPKSKTFSKYHLGNLSKDENHEIEILSGAFMLIRKKALEITGLLDEQFFMYGEDIDLSYRLILAGYKNYYYSKTTIIHYKGESTKKGSINYVRMFYNAMAIFARKHFSKGNANIFSFLISIAIWFRAFMALGIQFLKSIATPVLDGAIIFTGFYIITKYWEEYKYHGDGNYPLIFLQYVVPGYILLWLFSVFYLGGYSRPVKIKNVFKGIGLGILLVLVFYALLNETMRFSRAILLIGMLWVVIAIPTVRYLLHFSTLSVFKLYKYRKKRIVLAGSAEECVRVEQLLKNTGLQFDLIGFVTTKELINNNKYIGGIDELTEIAQINRIDEIVFCSRDIPSANVIRSMVTLSALNIDYKIAGPESIAIIGSNSIDTAGDLYEVHFNSIASEINRRNKRLIDIIFSILLLVFLPIIIFVVKNPVGLVKNIALVFAGFKTWVGYIDNQRNNMLPKLKLGILSPELAGQDLEMSSEIAAQMNLLYAKDYKMTIDIACIFKKLKETGKTNNKQHNISNK
jgi:GT2 family glycosyltransferase